jgi:hypothetical protein
LLFSSGASSALRFSVKDDIILTRSACKSKC